MKMSRYFKNVLKYIQYNYYYYLCARCVRVCVQIYLVINCYKLLYTLILTNSSSKQLLLSREEVGESVREVNAELCTLRLTSISFAGTIFGFDGVLSTEKLVFSQYRGL